MIEGPASDRLSDVPPSLSSALWNLTTATAGAAVQIGRQLPDLIARAPRAVEALPEVLAELSALPRRVGGVDAALAGLGPVLADVLSRVRALADDPEIVDRVDRLSTAVIQLAGAADSIAELARAREDIARLSGAVQPLAELAGAREDLSTLAGAVQPLRELSGVREDLSTLAGAVEPLRELSEVRADLHTLAGAVEALRELATARDDLSALAGAVGPLADLARAGEHLGPLAAAVGADGPVRRIAAAVDDPSGAPVEGADPPRLVALDANLTRAADHLASVAPDLRSVAARIDALDRQIGVLADALAPLQGTTERIGRIVDRFPDRSRRGLTT